MSGLDRRRALKLLGGLGGAAGFAAACGSAQGAETTQLYESHIRVGLLLPTSGGYQSIGEEIRNGFRRYLHANGNRLGGHPVVEEEVDEGTSSETALAATEELLARGVHAIIGVASSPAMLAVAPVVEDAHVPLLGVNASPRDLQGVTYIWRTSYVNHEPGLAIGGYLAAEVDGPVAIVAQDDATGTDAVAGLREAFAVARQSDRLSEPILTPTNSQPDTGFFAQSLAAVEASEPETIFCCYAGAAAVTFVQEYLDAGFDADRLYAPAYLTEGAPLAELGRAALGIKTSANYAPGLRSPTNQSFAVDFRAEFASRPTIYAVAAYDATAAVDIATRLAADDLSPRRLNLMLSRIGLLDSPRGRWQFNQSRTPTQKWYLREVTLDGPVPANTVLRQLGTLG